ASANFEELHLLTPGLSWSPDAKHIAIAAKAGETDAIFILDVNGNEAERRLPNIDVDGIGGVKWSPDGKTLAFVATVGGQSDIYIYDLDKEQARNLTNDVFPDHEPTWTPDSKAIYFTSERENNILPGQYPLEY